MVERIYKILVDKFNTIEKISDKEYLLMLLRNILTFIFNDFFLKSFEISQNNDEGKLWLIDNFFLIFDIFSPHWSIFAP